jgi:hypothetical protein
MKQNRRRRHLRPRYTRPQINQSIRQYELALEALRVEVVFERTRPEPSTNRLRWMQERANMLMDLIASAGSC